MKKVAIVVFPGSNCDQDAFHVFSEVLGFETQYHWHTQAVPHDYDLVLLPGGFSYGDYLRAGAMAKVSPAVTSLQAYIDQGGLVLGICNGFQILTDAGYLPGALSINQDSQFRCQDAHIQVCNNQASLTAGLDLQRTFRLPVAHREGRYVVDPETLSQMKKNDQIAMRYVSAPDVADPQAGNFNGSQEQIAGVYNVEKNVLGMMPHPERACEAILGNTDGLDFFQPIVRLLQQKEVA